MVQKFKVIFLDYFNRDIKIRKKPRKNTYVLETSINNIWYILKKWDKGKIPQEIKGNSTLFGAYLAGLIDGDGHVKIKHNTKDRIIPQCVIRISSDHPLREVRNLIMQHIGCEAHFVYDGRNRGVDTCFYISKKSINFVKDCIYPHIILKHKTDKLIKFFKMKEYEPSRT